MATTIRKKSTNDSPPFSEKKSGKNETQNDSSFSSDADNSLSALFVSELKDMYWAENHLVKSIPKMISASSSDELRSALEDHLEITRGHAERIEKIFGVLGEKILAKKCDALEGLVMGGEHVIENTVSGTPTRDIGIITSGLKVENFEITSYKGLINIASALGKNDVADLLRQNMQEEEEAANLLSSLVQKTITGK